MHKNKWLNSKNTSGEQKNIAQCALCCHISSVYTCLKTFIMIIYILLVYFFGGENIAKDTYCR